MKIWFKWSGLVKFEKRVFSFLGFYIFSSWILSMFIHKDLYSTQELIESILSISILIIFYFLIFFLTYSKQNFDKLIYSILFILLLISFFGAIVSL